MKTEFAIKKLNEVKSRLNILTLTCAGLIFVCVILSITVMNTSNNQKIILVPPAAKGQMEVNNGHFSPDYLREMTVFFTTLRLSVSPESISSSQETLINYVDPHFYKAFKKVLLAEKNAIQQGKISSIFYVKNIRSNSSKNTSYVEGSLKKFVGDREISNEDKSYLIKYSYNNGLIKIKSFSQVENK